MKEKQPITGHLINPISMKHFLVISLALIFSQLGYSQSKLTRVDIGATSEPANSEVNLTLEARNQHYNQNPTNAKDVFEKSINSPKSAVFTPDQKKLYVHSLEGYSTTVYDGTTWKKQKVITHKFGKHNDSLFKNSEYTVFDYKYRKKDGKGNQEAKERVNHNEFSGKPVESCLSHNGKYLWVTYYRRSYDKNAESPSAVAIIDTELDEIVRVMPTGPLPKMIACSPNNKYIAVTHWGDNTVGIIDIQSDNVMEFKYIKHCIVDYRAKLDFNSTEVVNRDNSCGNCLRGTLFTPDGNFLIVGKMGGSGGLMIFDTRDFSSLGTVKGLKRNVRHLIINKEDLYVSTNSSGYVQKCNWKDLTKFRIENEGSSVIFSEWKNVYVGIGARTISVSDDGKYVYVAISNECKIKVIRTSDMSVVATIDADSYPVGMALSPDQKHLVVTSQGKKSSGGNSVMIFEITLK